MTELVPLLGVSAAFAIEVGAVLLTLRNVLSQKLTRVLDTKAVLVLMHIFILSIFTLEFMRFFLSASTDFMVFYTDGVVSLVIWTGILLASLAYIVYFRPSEPTFRDRVVALVMSRLFPFGIMLIAFCVYFMAVDLYVIIYQPFSFVVLSDVAGVVSSTPLFDGKLRLLVLSLYVIFLLFPSTQFVFAIRAISDPTTKRAVSILVGGWGVIALIALVIYGFLPAGGINAIGPGQLVAGLVLGVTGFGMRKTSILEAMFEPVKGGQGEKTVNNGGPRAGRPVSNYKGTMLLEADPSANYERAVKDFASEMAGSGRLVFAFTSRGSPVYLLLKDIPNLRFFVLSESSYPKPSGGTLEVMVPRNDHSVLLNLMDETVTRNPEQTKAIIFDNISSFILDSGFQDTYKFLRQVNEILSHGDVISIFLILSKAHDDKVMNTVRNLFSGQLSYDANGLHFTKQS